MADSVKEKIGHVGFDIPPLAKFKSQFIDDYSAESLWRENRREYGKFYDGDQITTEEKRELENRGQPPVVVNRIKPKLDAIFGIVQELGVETKAYPLGDRENEAADISERFRSIENDSHFNEEELQVFKDMTIDGRGYYETFNIWDGLEKRTITEHVPNHFIVVDRYCRRPDLKDAKRVHKHVWKDLEDAIEDFPEYEADLRAANAGPDAWAKMADGPSSQYRPDQYQEPGGSWPVSELMGHYEQFIDPQRKRVRIVTTYHRTIRVKHFLTAGGVTQDVTDMSEADKNKVKTSLPDFQEWTQNDREVNSATFCWNAILEEKKNLRPFDREGKFPIVMAHAYVTREEEGRRPYGLVKQHLDPQREVNKRRSKMLHLLNTNQVWFEDGAFDNETVSRAEAARPDGWIKKRKEFEVTRVTHQDVAQAQFQLLQESKKEIDEAGVNEEIEGQSKATSGREFQLRLKEGLKSIRELMNNIRAARRRVAEYWLDDILEDMKREARAQDQPFELRKYDVVIEEAAESVNLQSETFQTLAGLASDGFPIPPATIIKVSPLDPKTKDEILSQMQNQAEAQAASGAPPQPMAKPRARKPK